MMSDLAVVIVSYNVRYYLEQCLLSVQCASKGLNVEVWVVDNNSSDGSVEFLCKRFPEVHFIANSKNVGFSRANNQAIRQCQSRYVLLLNPDTIVTEKTFHDCVAFMDADPEIGALGVSMFGSNGRFALESRRALPVPFTSFCKLTGLTALFPKSKLFGRYYMRFLDETKPERIEVISGAFNMLRRKALDEIGLLDEDFFMYGEDIDLSYRMTLGGWQNWYLPTPIIHYKGESTQTQSVHYVNTFYEAMIIFMEKHFAHRYHHATILFRAGIYARAGLDIAKRGIRRVFALLPHHEKPEMALCIGRQENVNKMCALCVAHGINATEAVGDASSRPQGHLHSSFDKDYRYVVYDSSAYSYEQIINLLRDGFSRYPNAYLGVYHPNEDVIVLPGDVLSLK